MTLLIRIIRHNLVALAAIAASAHAQRDASVSPQTPPRIITLGDGTISGLRLSPYDNAWRVTQVFPNGHVNEPGIWTDQLRVRDVDGVRRFVRTQGLVYPGGHAQWSVNVLDTATLAPIRSEFHNVDGSVQVVRVNRTHVETHEQAGSPGAAEKIRQFDLDTPAYELTCCMPSLLAAALPLRVGYSVSVPAIAAFAGDTTVIGFTVVRREKVAAGFRGDVDAWVVEFPNPGCCMIRFWVTETPRMVVRMTLSLGPAHEFEQSFDLIR